MIDHTEPLSHTSLFIHLRHSEMYAPVLYFYHEVNCLVLLNYTYYSTVAFKMCRLQCYVHSLGFCTEPINANDVIVNYISCYVMLLLYVTYNYLTCKTHSLRYYIGDEAKQGKGEAEMIDERN